MKLPFAVLPSGPARDPFLSRRAFLGNTGLGLGAVALGDLLARDARAAAVRATGGATAAGNPLLPKAPPGRARAKRIIYLGMSGAPPSLDLFDWKPKLKELNGKPCPDSFLKGQRFAFIKGVPKMLGTPYRFSQHGRAGGWFSELVPHMAGVADELCMVKSLWTDQFNHAPAELFTYTGNMRAGAASLGSWVTYGLGSENQNLPGYVVLLSGGTDPTGGKSLWSAGFLPSVYQGVQCRSSGEPVLYSNNPAGMDRDARRRSLDAVSALNVLESERSGDPETLTRIQQYELAFRMQASVPEVFDITQEPESVRAAYGAKPGETSFANNCLLARRLVEKGVRYVQLYDWGWDMHGTGPSDDLITALPRKCREVDQACAALIRDLKQRGLLEDTLVVWGGEFGRTPMNEARAGSTYLGRDHHPHCFTMWMAGGGFKPGFVHGDTDEIGYGIVSGKVTIRDLQATLLACMGFDPYHLSFRYLGLEQRLIGPTDEGKIANALLS